MDHYSNEQPNLELSKFKKDQNSLEVESESESEFDAFEHHLSQYENKELFNNDDDELMDCGSNIDREEFLDEHQISLATSFCKNTQEQNEDFLEDKFNGDLLLENFSEEKFIRCKYSEDFYFEQQSNHQFNGCKQQFESDEDEHYNHDANEHDKYSEKSSEDDIAIRKRHFLDFVCTIPKICTPSVCGTIPQSNQLTDSFKLDLNLPDNDINLGKLTEANEEALFEDDETECSTNHNFNKFNSFSNFTLKKEDQDDDYEQHKFDWSIDQLATLKPVNISINERRFLRFKDFEQDQLTQEKLSKENELFFSQETIAPSPTKHPSAANSCLKPNDSRKHQTDFSSIEFDRQSLQIKFRGNDKDSGNYSNAEAINERASSKNKELNEFELSFIEHSANNRLSNIEFDYDMNKLNTPSRRSSPKLNHQTKLAEQWTNLDYNKIHQTSTPCTSLFRPKFNQNQVEENGVDCDDKRLNSKQTTQNSSLPLQERTDSLKQKKRLFHNLTIDTFAINNNDNLTVTSSSLINSEKNRSSLSESKSMASSRNDFTSISVDFNSNDEGICESSREVTFGSAEFDGRGCGGDNSSSATSNDVLNASNESISAYNNNSLTPTFKKRRSSSIVKSFAERLNEIDLFNDENNDVNNSTNKSTSDQNKWHNLTDSNCFVIKNFNNLLNNSDSGCYLSNNSNSNSGFSLKKRVLFN